MELQKLTTLAGAAMRNTAGSFTWGPMVNFSQNQILHIFQRIKRGCLIIETVGGTRYCYGDDGKALKTILQVKSDSFWVRLSLFADMGFAESYMLGEVECSDLTSFFKIFILNREQLSDGSTLSSLVLSTVTAMARSTNTLSNSLLNVAAHYDISNDMFAAFLSDDMTYSCPVFELNTEPTKDDLEEAQLRKLNFIIEKAKIKHTDRVLEFGTGWGSFAIETVRQTGCSITSLTLSKEQKALAEKRIAAAGFESNIEVILCDYRAFPATKRFDKIVSIEMLEAVGKEYLTTYFDVVDRLLKLDGGIAVFQCITMPEGRSDAYSKGDDFIRKYIFPGGYLPSHTQLIDAATAGSNGKLVLESVDNIGGHYTRTLRFWCQSFLENFESRIMPSLKKRDPSMTEADIEVFKRKWEYYFTYCEAGFATKILNDIIFTVGRDGATELYEGIPL